MGTKNKSKCPTCKKNSAPLNEKGSPYPFCSARCKTIDLGKWVNEEYKIEDEESHSNDDDDD